jgi:hypothetical protein
LIALFAVAACVVTDRPPVLGADVCAPEVEAALAPHGLSLATMAEPQWFIDRYADADVPEDAQPISGYRFRGRPPECASGAVAVAMWERCAVNEVRTVGDCRIDGLFHTWF